MVITRRSMSRLAWWLIVGGPLFGLLGTVAGMARAFGNLAEASGAAKAQALAANISMCLWTTVAGMMVGYLIYDSTHFLVHHYSMPTKFGKFIKRHHMRHHFKDPDKDYGVSSPLWDVIFRTFSGDRNRTTPKTAVGTGA